MTTVNRLYISSLKENNDFAFVIKLVNELLPTINILNTRKPNLYTSNQCILCNNKCVETMSHLVSCNSLQKQWEQVEIDVSIEFTKFLEKELKDKEEFIEIDLFNTILFPK